MLAFRSEEHVKEWCGRKGIEVRPLITLEQQWQLASRWFANRLTAEWPRPTADEGNTFLASLGLTGPFWKL